MINKRLAILTIASTFLMGFWGTLLLVAMLVAFFANRLAASQALFLSQVEVHRRDQIV